MSWSLLCCGVALLSACIRVPPPVAITFILLFPADPTLHLYLGACLSLLGSVPRLRFGGAFALLVSVVLLVIHVLTVVLGYPCRLLETSWFVVIYVIVLVSCLPWSGFHCRALALDFLCYAYI